MVVSKRCRPDVGVDRGEGGEVSAWKLIPFAELREQREGEHGGFKYNWHIQAAIHYRYTERPAVQEMTVSQKGSSSNKT